MGPNKQLATNCRFREGDGLSGMNMDKQRREMLDDRN